jgi:phosphatidylglycerophosphate synthase
VSAGRACGPEGGAGDSEALAETFILAALTDYVDGYLARAWQQESNFGRMLDPIADKAMVVIALSVIVGLSGINPLILVPVAFILCARSSSRDCASSSGPRPGG